EGADVECLRPRAGGVAGVVHDLDVTAAAEDQGAVREIAAEARGGRAPVLAHGFQQLRGAGAAGAVEHDRAGRDVRNHVLGRAEQVAGDVEGGADLAGEVALTVDVDRSRAQVDGAVIDLHATGVGERAVQVQRAAVRGPQGTAIRPGVTAEADRAAAVG